MDSICGQKVVVTGFSGFVGSNIQKYLGAYYQIEPLSARFIPEQKFVFECNVIIHLGGKAHDLKKVAQPQDYYDANFELTKQLFDAFLVSEARVFVFMSTVKAVADEVKGILYEDEEPNPKTHYGIAKQLAEQYILSQVLPEGKRVYILRPCMIHGPRNKGNLNLLYQLVAKGFPWPLGAFDNQRSFLSVENLCFMIKELIGNETIPSGIYNMADDVALSSNRLIKILGESLGKSAKIVNLSPKVIRSIAKIGDVFPLPLNSERLQKLTESYVVSNQKIIQAIGKPLPKSSTDGLRLTFKSLRK